MNLKKYFQQPRVMGILNVTPDSFSDGGIFFLQKKNPISPHPAVLRGLQMIREGVDIIDVGGESTGPGSLFVPLEEELRRVIPVIRKISLFAREKNALISIDTYKAEVARKAILAGADMINDVTALRGDPAMAEVLAKHKVPIILMYSKDTTPRTTRKKIRYKNVIATIENFLKARIKFADNHGIQKSQIILDPGMGAFLSGIPDYSFEVLYRLGELKKLGFPLLLGSSRKSMFGGFMEDRFIPGLFAAAVAWQNGASCVRVHNTKEAVQLRNMRC